MILLTSMDTNNSELNLRVATRKDINNLYPLGQS